MRWVQFSALVMVVAMASLSVRGEEPLRLRVLSYNIHHAEGVDGKLDLPRIADVIRAARPDVVSLQEVDQNTLRTGQVDQAQALAELVDMHYAFGGNIELQGGSYGNAVLSRFPIVRHRNHLLPNTDGGEQRGVLVAELEVPGFETEGSGLVFLATHFDHRRDEQQRIDSARAINTILGSDSRASILAGDLNAVPESKPLKLLGEQWVMTNPQPLPTIPVDEPTRQIDFILYRPADRWRVIETRVLDEAIASDHRPILSVLEVTVK